MKLNKDIDLLIYSLDHELTLEDRQRLTTALAASADLRAEKERLLNIRQAIGQLKTTSSPLFVENVMASLHQMEQKVETKIIQLFPRVAAACIAFFILTFLTMSLTEANLTTDTFIGVENLMPEDAYSLLD